MTTVQQQTVSGDRAIVLSGVGKTYAGGVVALRDVDVAVLPGEMVAVVGASGSGKSTLLNLVGCLDRPTSGRVCIGGNDVGLMGDPELSRLRGVAIGFVFQQFHLIDSLTVIDNVALPLIYRGTSRRERERVARESLDRVGLTQRARHHPGRLSGGERQRAAIARALVTSPLLVLADEPTGNLDSRTGDEIVDLFRSLNAEGSTLMMITHDRDRAASFPRVLTIHDGQLVDDRRRQ